LESIKIYQKSSSFHEIEHHFHNVKEPFIVKNIINPKVDLNFLEKKFKNENVLSLNPNSDKELISMYKLIQKVTAGQKYRLRANTKIGNYLIQYIDTTFIHRLKKNKKHLFDFFLSLGKTSRQHTLFLSTKNCTFTKHAHIISGLIIHLDGEKTWYISKTRDKFSSIKYKNLLNPNPLYVTVKNPSNEIKFNLNPGDLLYMPAYWFHYTISHDTNISYSHFFTESIWYYFSKTFLMFIYQAITNPILALVKAIRREPEEHIYDRENIIKRCNRINNLSSRQEALQFFKDSDYS